MGSIEYDYQHALAAQHGIQLGINHQLGNNHPQMQIPMQLAAGLNLTVMPTSAMQGQQHHQLAGLQHGQHILYQQVQPGQNVTHVTHHQPQQQQQQVQQQNHHQNHHQQVSHQQHGHGGHGNQGGHGKGKKKPKVNKDGVPAPKRATTAYINFTQWYREELKKSGRPIPKIGEFGKECAAKWNSMNEEDKKPFLDVASKDRDRYKREMAIFKPARDANKPKRPGTAFMLFMGDFRKEMSGKEPEGGVAALAKLGGERWRNMTEDDKRPYVEKQNEEKGRYELAMEEYRRKSGGGVAGITAGSAATTESPTEPEDQSQVQQQQQQTTTNSQVEGQSQQPAPGTVVLTIVDGQIKGNDNQVAGTVTSDGQQTATVVTSIPLTIYSAAGGQLFTGQTFTTTTTANNGQDQSSSGSNSTSTNSGQYTQYYM